MRWECRWECPWPTFFWAQWSGRGHGQWRPSGFGKQIDGDLWPRGNLPTFSHTLACSKSSGLRYAVQRLIRSEQRRPRVLSTSYIAELQRKQNCNNNGLQCLSLLCFFFSPYPQTDNVSKWEKCRIVAQRFHTSSVNLRSCASGWRHVRSSAMLQRQSAHGCLRWLCSSSWKTRRCGSTTPAANKRVALHFI